MFGSKPKTTKCPACKSDIPKGTLEDHVADHVHVIAEGQGDATGQFTWNCSCGPAKMKWPKPHHAQAGMMVHMMERHSMRIGA